MYLCTGLTSRQRVRKTSLLSIYMWGLKETRGRGREHHTLFAFFAQSVSAFTHTDAGAQPQSLCFLFWRWTENPWTPASPPSSVSDSGAWRAGLLQGSDVKKMYGLIVGPEVCERHDSCHEGPAGVCGGHENTAMKKVPVNRKQMGNNNRQINKK